MVTPAECPIAAEGGEEAVGHFAGNGASPEYPLPRSHRVALAVQRFEGAIGQPARELQANGVGPHVDGSKDGLCQGVRRIVGWAFGHYQLSPTVVVPPRLAQAPCCHLFVTEPVMRGL